MHEPPTAPAVSFGESHRLGLPEESVALMTGRRAGGTLGGMTGLGTAHSALWPQPRRMYHRLFGTEDLHSHLRWNAIRRYVDYQAARTLEVGANTGVMTATLAPRLHGDLVSSEFDQEMLEVARRVIEARGLSNVSLSQADLRALSAEPGGFDQALAIDVLEHIDDDAQAVEELANALRPGGRLIVSVPTPRFVEVFGRAFHEQIGHVRDGYEIGDIVRLLEPRGFRVEAHHYYTGTFASKACSWHYRRGISDRGRLATTPLLAWISQLGERNVAEDRAAGLALVAVRL